MSARHLSEEAAVKLQDLAQTTRELQAAEARADELRDHRNRDIYEAIKAGATERKTAQVADVDPSYAHRCSVNEGNPKSGHRT